MCRSLGKNSLKNSGYEDERRYDSTVVQKVVPRRLVGDDIDVRIVGRRIRQRLHDKLDANGPGQAASIGEEPRHTAQEDELQILSKARRNDSRGSQKL